MPCTVASGSPHAVICSAVAIGVVVLGAVVLGMVALGAVGTWNCFLSTQTDRYKRFAECDAWICIWTR